MTSPAIQARCPACGWWGTITADHRVTTWTCPTCGRFYAVAEPTSDEIRMMLVTETPQEPTDAEVAAGIDALAEKAKRAHRGTTGHQWGACARIDQQAQRLKDALSDKPAETPQAWQFTREQLLYQADDCADQGWHLTAAMLREAAQHAPSSQAAAHECRDQHCECGHCECVHDGDGSCSDCTQCDGFTPVANDAAPSSQAAETPTPPTIERLKQDIAPCVACGHPKGRHSFIGCTVGAHKGAGCQCQTFQAAETPREEK